MAKRRGYSRLSIRRRSHDSRDRIRRAEHRRHRRKLPGRHPLQGGRGHGAQRTADAERLHDGEHAAEHGCHDARCGRQPSHGDDSAPEGDRESRRQRRGSHLICPVRPKRAHKI